MGEKDAAEKLLEDYEDVFADIVNGVIFQGEQRVRPDSLRESSVRSQYKAGGKVREQERDVAKYWMDQKIDIALLGVENQTDIDVAMPLRIMGYDGAAYRKQVHRKKKKVVPQKEDSILECVHGGNTEGFIPVVTLVLYFGTDRKWNSPTSLKDVLKVPKGLEDYVNDYRLHVVNVAWLTDEEIDCFQSDFKLVARFFVEKRKKNHEWMRNNRQEIKHVDEIIKLFSAMTGDSLYEEIIRNYDTKEVHTMCEVLEYYINEGRAEGRAEGRTEGRTEGRAEERIEMVARMIEKGFPVETILSLGVTKEQLQEAKNRLLGLSHPV